MNDGYIAWLTNLSQDDRKIAGEKAANLGELFNQKYPIPQGFALTTKAFNHILKENNVKDEIISILKRIDIKDERNLKEKSEEIQNLILSCTISPEITEEILESYDNLNTDLSGLKDSPGALAILKSAREPIFVSVRSSPINEENKGLQAFTNIRGNRELIEKIKICLASPFSVKAIKRRKQSGGNDFEEMGVIVQKMINSEKSGVIYSRNPNGKGILVEAIFGQGCSIPGKIEPDRYELDDNLEITNENISNKKLAVIRTAGGQTKFIELQEEKSVARVLKTYEIKQIAEIAKKIEEHYQFPQEIEFAIEDSNFYILQSRPIKEKEIPLENISMTPLEKTNIQIKSEVDNSRDSKIATEIGIPEIGLIRLEKIMAKKGKHPLRYISESSLDEYQRKIEEELEKILLPKENKSWVRLSEFRNDKYQNLLGSPNEEFNPLMGNSGIRFLLKNISILKAEISAIKNIRDKGMNVGIILPKVISTDEIQKVWDTVNGMGIKNLEIGVSIDTPASAILIKDFIDFGMKFVSISLDDLTEYTIAVDSKNYEIKNLYEEKSWAVLKLVSRIVRECKNNSIETSIYGSLLENEETLEFLGKRQIDSITVSPILAHRIVFILKEIERKNSFVK